MVRRSRKEIYILSACVALLSLQSALRVSARTAADFFADAPVGVIDTFDRNTRLDMLDYFRNGMTTASQNVFGGQSRITALSDSSLTVEISSRSRMQFAMLPQKSDTVVVIIETVDTPVADSGVSFYRASDWSRMDVDMPGLRDFLPSMTKKSRRMPDALPHIFTTAEYKPASGRFVFTNTTAGNYSADDMPQAVKDMPDSLVYTFDGRRLKPWKLSD